MALSAVCGEGAGGIVKGIEARHNLNQTHRYPERPPDRSDLATDNPPDSTYNKTRAIHCFYQFTWPRLVQQCDFPNDVVAVALARDDGRGFAFCPPTTETQLRMPTTSHTTTIRVSSPDEDPSQRLVIKATHFIDVVTATDAVVTLKTVLSLDKIQHHGTVALALEASNMGRSAAADKLLSSACLRLFRELLVAVSCLRSDGSDDLIHPIRTKMSWV